MRRTRRTTGACASSSSSTSGRTSAWTRARPPTPSASIAPRWTSTPRRIATAEGGSFSFRYYCVVMVTNALTHTDLNATEKDIRFLKEVLADENEEHASRVRVAVVLGASPSPHKPKR